MTSNSIISEGAFRINQSNVDHRLSIRKRALVFAKESFFHEQDNAIQYQ